MRNLRFHGIAVLLLCLYAGLVGAQGVQLAADINETVVSIPVISGGKATGGAMVGTVFKPDGAGPFPFVVLNHGRAGSAPERAQVRRWRYTDAARP